jgi:hypothetical protein
MRVRRVVALLKVMLAEHADPTPRVTKAAAISILFACRQCDGSSILQTDALADEHPTANAMWFV